MSTVIDFTEVKSEIRKLVAEIAEVEEAEVKDEAVFTDDLGVDSMMALEIVASIEKKYKAVIPEDQIPTICSLNDVMTVLEKTLL